MTAVTLADACLRLPELIALTTRGEHVVIVQNGVVLAALTPAPFQIPTAEEEAARRAVAVAAMNEMNREMARQCVADGIPLGPDHPLRQYLDAESPAA